jgi:dephospho-CoA kinase
MLVVGITGGIGTGKSTVTALFRQCGAATYSADEAAREVVVPGSLGLAEITSAFGTEVLLPDGHLNRRRLGEIVFSDPDARRRLEAITHPRIRERMREWITQTQKASPPDAVLLLEVPLLYEGGLETWFDRVVVVTAPESSQISRLLAREGMTEEQARRRIAAQMPLSEKEARADLVLPNDGDLDALSNRVHTAWNQFRTLSHSLS